MEPGTERRRSTLLPPAKNTGSAIRSGTNTAWLKGGRELESPDFQERRIALTAYRDSGTTLKPKLIEEGHAGERVCYWRVSTQRLIAEAVHNVIVDQTHGLHEGIADCGPDKVEAALLEVFAHGVRFRRARRNLLH